MPHAYMTPKTDALEAMHHQPNLKNALKGAGITARQQAMLNPDWRYTQTGTHTQIAYGNLARDIHG